MTQVSVEFFDTTLRDGAQSLPIENQFPDGSKVDIAEEIGQLHGGVIEAGFPRTPGDEAEVREVAKIVGNSAYSLDVWRDGVKVDSERAVPTIAGLCRTKEEDIDPAWAAVNDAALPRIHTFVSTDPEHMAAKFPDMTPDQVHDMGVRAVSYARQIMSDHPTGTVEFSAEAASTTDNDYLERIVRSAVAAGADVINVPDTVGQRDPFWMHSFYRRVIGWVMAENIGTVISAHNHNDLDLATANSISLVSAAAEHAAEFDQPVSVQVETTVCGLGERAGNADIFSVAAGLFKFADQMPVPVTWRFNPGRSVETARMVLGAGNMVVHRQAPVVGADIKTHRSGIHSDGVIKGGFQIYTPHNPRFWGHETDARHEEGKYQGAKGRLAAQRA